MFRVSAPEQEMLIFCWTAGWRCRLGDVRAMASLLLQRREIDATLVVARAGKRSVGPSRLPVGLTLLPCHRPATPEM